MEDTLREDSNWYNYVVLSVLILVLMEDTLRGGLFQARELHQGS